MPYPFPSILGNGVFYACVPFIDADLNLKWYRLEGEKENQWLVEEKWKVVCSVYFVPFSEFGNPCQVLNRGNAVLHRVCQCCKDLVEKPGLRSKGTCLWHHYQRYWLLVSEMGGLVETRLWSSGVRSPLLWIPPPTPVFTLFCHWLC